VICDQRPRSIHLIIRPLTSAISVNLLPVIPPTYLPAAFSLTATGVWGTSDFLGGLGARRVNTFLFTLFVHLSAMVMAGLLALALGSQFLDLHAALWSLGAGIVGGLGVALFYRALAVGKMGLVAPLSAVLGAGVATMIAGFSQGIPTRRHLAGFVLAGIGVWLISRTEKEAGGTDGSPVPAQATENEGRPQGLGLAILAGLGFAGFFFCIHRAGDGSPLWIAVFSRIASLFVSISVIAATRQFHPISPRIFGLAFFAGILDITGTVVFVRATQIGRLDSAVVLSSLYPAITVILARIFLHEHFSRTRTVGMLAALAAVPMIAG